MRGVGFSPSASEEHPLLKASHGILLIYLAVIYAGCLQFFITFSSALLYGTYLVIVGCLTISLFINWHVIRQLKSIVIYLIWIFAYLLWASLASADNVVFFEGVRLFIKNVLLISALAIALTYNTIRRFSGFVQLAVVGNCCLSVWEAFDPELVRAIALTRQEDATAFNVLRPAGLWSNPDEAAFAIIFALLLSRWASPRLAALGRIAGLTALILTASRTGTYLTVFCMLILAAERLRSLRPAYQLLILASILPAIAAILLTVQGLSVPDINEHGQISRIFDINESTRDPDAASRLEIAITAVTTALDHPWYGSGLFTFQCEGTFPAVLDVPSHNVYLTVWGEAGPVVFATYLFILAYGLFKSYLTLSPSRDCTTLMLMWICYLIIGITWHNQFTSFSGMLYISLLLHLHTVIHPFKNLYFAIGDQRNNANSFEQ
ncbi:MAG: hypothetical protein JWL59_4744 [Chthoniobacteraceae bacterium]|nr:hypothetical protein [Chthoniobacteraceae bacterium]